MNPETCSYLHFVQESCICAWITVTYEKWRVQRTKCVCCFDVAPACSPTLVAWVQKKKNSILHQHVISFRNFQTTWLPESWRLFSGCCSVTNVKLPQTLGNIPLCLGWPANWLISQYCFTCLKYFLDFSIGYVADKQLRKNNTSEFCKRLVAELNQAAPVSADKDWF